MPLIKILAMVLLLSSSAHAALNEEISPGISNSTIKKEMYKNLNLERVIDANCASSVPWTPFKKAGQKPLMLLVRFYPSIRKYNNIALEELHYESYRIYS